MNKIAASMFSAGAMDKLLAIDVYEQTDSKTKTGFISQVKSFGKEAMDSIRTLPGLARDFAGTITFEGGKVKLDKNELKGRLIDLAGNASGPFSKLSAAAQNSVLSSFGASPETAGMIRTAIGDGFSMLTSSEVDDARGLVGMLETITGNTGFAKLFDLEAEMALFGGILGEAIRLGVPDAIDELYNKFKDDENARKVFSDNLLMAATSGDLATVKRIINKIGLQAALSQVPDLIQIILMGYTFKPLTTASEWPVRLTELKDTLTSINPDWYRYKRNGVWINDLAPFTYISEDARKLFMTDADLKEATMIAGEFPSEDIMSILTRNYPMAAFSSKLQ